MEYQLRIYKVKEGEMEAFLGVFPEVVAARRAVGFDVVGAWSIPEENQFIWIVGAENIESTSERYYASAQRKAIEPEPGRLLETVDTRTMVAVPT